MLCSPLSATHHAYHRSSSHDLFSIHSSLLLFPGGRRPEVQVFFLHSSLYIPKYSLRSMLYSSRSELFLIVFLESKVVKSMIPTPTCDRPSREPPPNVHIWPRSALEKGPKSAFFKGEVESSGREGGVKPPLRMSPRRLGERASCRKSPWNFKGCAHRQDDSPMLPAGPN